MFHSSEFAGAPFTLAAYAIEGKGSQQYTYAKRFMYQHPECWFTLLDKLSDAIIDYINLQIESGVHAVQIFDSWVGCLSEVEYRKLRRACNTQTVFWNSRWSPKDLLCDR